MHDLPHLDYARICCIIGHSPLAMHATNTTAPDSGNMEVLHDYGSPSQKSLYLEGLKDGSIRSAFCMTEPEVASSDARNVGENWTRGWREGRLERRMAGATARAKRQQSIVPPSHITNILPLVASLLTCLAPIIAGGTTFERVERDGREGYVVNGRKWWSTGVNDPRCKFMIVMGKIIKGEEKEKGHTMVIVPRDAEGFRIVRNLTVFGHDDAPFGHAEVEFTGCWVPTDNLLGGEGQGGR